MAFFAFDPLREQANQVVRLMTADNQDKVQGMAVLMCRFGSDQGTT